MVCLVRLRRIILSSPLICAAASCANAGEIGDAVKSLAGAATIRERISLKDLGLTQPVVLGSTDARREIYLPVPANVSLAEPSLVINGHYLRADGGRTTYTLALDGNVVAARSPADDAGDANIRIGVDGAPRPSGFVRLGLAWSSVTGRFLCDDERSIGNVLQISPDSYFDYGYDPSGVKDIAGAWSALPRKVLLLIAADTLENASYDAAWRLGVALERAGKAVEIVALPKPGSEVDVTGLDIPAPLAAVPAFAALAKGGKITLSSDAEVGALLLLNAPQVRAHIAVADPALAAGLKAALDAVAGELAKADPGAAGVLDALSTRNDTLLQPAGPKAVEIHTMAGRPVIAVAPDAAAAASNLFDSLWRRTALASRLVLNTVGKPEIGADSVALGAIDQAAGNLDVVARGDWTTTFDMGAGLFAGKVPSTMDIEVAAAPGATTTSPVASVFINDYLLGAKRLAADGKPERISVAVPSYTLLPRNTVRVQFQRQPASDNCREVPQAFPAAVLPGSRIWLKSAPAAQDFSGMVSQLSGDSVVMVPQAWQAIATRTLPAVIHVADAAGVSPARADFSASATNASLTPQKPFLAFDVAVAGAVEAVKVAGDRVSIADKKGNIFYDVSGLDRIAVLQAVTDMKQPGISYRTIGQGPQFGAPFRFARGDIAVLGQEGILASTSSSGVPLYLNEDGSQGASNEPFTWSKLLDPDFWAHNLSWLITVIIIAAFLLLLLLAQRARKRAGSDQA